MKIVKIYSITIAKEFSLLWDRPVRTEIVIQNPDGIVINVDAGECRGGISNDLMGVCRTDPQELFGNGVTVVADALIDPEDDGELFNDEVTLFPQFSINMKGALHDDAGGQI